MESTTPQEPEVPEASASAPAAVMDPPASAWPKVIGIISLLYALCGLLCQVAAVGMTWFGAEQLMKMGGVEAEMPMLAKVVAAVTAVFVTIAGLLMLSGAIGLLRRRRAGVSRLRAWAVLRMALLVISVVVTIFTIPSQLEFQRLGQEMGNRRAREAGRADFVREWDEDAAWRQSMIGAAGFTAVTAVYPLFIGFYLSRKKVAAEVAGWD